MSPTNPFAALDFPASLHIDSKQLDAQFKSLSAAYHPDAQESETTSPDEQRFKEINKAYNTLKHPHTRALALLELEDITYNSRGSVSDSIMSHFMPIGELLQSIDEHLKKLENASSQLQKALLSPKSLDLQSELETWIQTLDNDLDQTESTLLSSDLHSEAIQIAIRDTAFLQKWKAQLRERFAQLFI
ncbi:DnaJ domain-containing protein [Akkermansiaceae bacterium]|nr:DnaJ domain-containing protein [Akkermansiaceae bacterium]